MPPKGQGTANHGRDHPFVVCRGATVEEPGPGEAMFQERKGQKWWEKDAQTNYLDTLFGNICHPG